MGWWDLRIRILSVYAFFYQLLQKMKRKQPTRFSSSAKTWKFNNGRGCKKGLKRFANKTPFFCDTDVENVDRKVDNVGGMDPDMVFEWVFERSR